MPIIEAHGLSKAFGNFIALQPISFEINQGEILALLGSNGAGKTTTLRILAGMLKPTAGRAKVAGIDVTADPLAIKSLIGYLPETPALYAKLTGLEFLMMIARLRDFNETQASKRVHELIRVLNLEDRITVQIGNYSRGMKQKLAFAATIIHHPKVLILDEPTSGLDPRYAKMIKNWIKHQADNGTAVILSSHLTNVVQALCTHVIILDRGYVIATGSPEAILTQTSTNNLEDAFVNLVGDSEWTGL